MAIYPGRYKVHCIGPDDSPLERNLAGFPMLRVNAYSYSEARKLAVAKLPPKHTIDRIERED